MASDLLSILIPGSRPLIFSIFLLRSLDLSHNQLTDIEEGSFQSLPSLQILKIQNNRIAALGKKSSTLCRHPVPSRDVTYQTLPGRECRLPFFTVYVAMHGVPL
jgi:hypothetical protein